MAHDDGFERAWALYPKRAGGNSKKAAYAKWRARVRDGVQPEELLAGVQRYAAFIRATGKWGTEYVKQAETFFGPKEYWREDWTLPSDSGRAAGGFVA